MKKEIGNFPIKFMCIQLKVSYSGFNDWTKRLASETSIKRENVFEKIKFYFEKSLKLYGSPRITKCLEVEGIIVSESYVAKLMKENNLVAKTKKKFRVISTGSKHNLPVAENILNRNFSAEQAGTAWVSDITYIPTKSGFVYLAAVMDLFSRKIIGWHLSENMKSEIVIKALTNAISTSTLEKNCIIHSDQGVQYASEDYRNVLSLNNFIQSMSRKGNCWDNAVMESFFHTLKTELLYFLNLENYDEVKKELFVYIEMFYNRERLHSSLGYLSPHMYEQKHLECA